MHDQGSPGKGGGGSSDSPGGTAGEGGRQELGSGNVLDFKLCDKTVLVAAKKFGLLLASALRVCESGIVANGGGLQQSAHQGSYLFLTLIATWVQEVV